jgi:hypothetical protein
MGQTRTACDHGKMGVPLMNAVCMALFLVCMYCSTSEAAIFHASQAATTLLKIENVSEWAVSVRTRTSPSWHSVTATVVRGLTLCLTRRCADGLCGRGLPVQLPRHRQHFRVDQPAAL